MKITTLILALICFLGSSSLWGQEKNEKAIEVEQRVARWMEALETHLDVQEARADSLTTILHDFAEQMYSYRQAEQELKIALMKMRDQKVQKLLSKKQYAHYQKTMSDLQKQEFEQKRRQSQMEQMEEQRRQQNLEPNLNRGRRRNGGIGNRRRRGF